jgi:cytochrome c556
MQDLEQLLSGSALSSAEATESQAGNLIDIVPLMQLVDRSYSQAIKPFSANESEFKKNASELQTNSQLVAVLAQLALAKGMPNAEDDTFVQLANEMLQSAQQVAFAAESQQAQLARTAAGKLGQSCVQCHENYR